MQSVKDIKVRHQKEVNEFKGLFFAFNNKQLKEGLEKVNLTENETNKIYSIGAGGYIRKDRSTAFSDMFKKQKEELKKVRQEQKTIDIKFVGIDGWNRPIFKTINKPTKFYGSVTTLFNDNDTKEKVLSKICEDDLLYFGESFGCEPMGTLAGNIKIE